MVRFVLVLCLVLVVPATAYAAPPPESEPNGDLWVADAFTADGVKGVIAGVGDLDLYRFNVRPGVDGQFTLTHEGGGECTVEVRTLDRELGDSLELFASGGSTSSEEWFAEEEAIPAVIIVSGEPGCAYSVTVSPGDLVGPEVAASPRQQVAEPNDEPEQAVGPIKQGVMYTGVASSIDDPEWLYLYLLADVLNEIELISPTPECFLSMDLYGLDKFGEPSRVLTVEAEGPSVSSGFYETSGNGAVPHFIEVTSDEGCAWGVRISNRLGSGPRPRLGVPIEALKVRLRASRHSDGLLRRRGGIQSTCRVNMAARCRVVAWLPRAAAKRAGISVPRRKSKIRIGSGSAAARKAGVIKPKVRISSRLRKKLIAHKGALSVQLTAKATARHQKPATATTRVRVGS